MAGVHLTLLGRPLVRRDGHGQVPIASSLQPFLALLSLERDMACDRDRLIEHLWPDAAHDRARHRLNTVVWRCRRLLGDPHGAIVVANRNGHIALDRSAVEADVNALAQALSEERRAAATRGDASAVEQLRDAARVDASQFLAGNYDEWVVSTRHRLELAVMKGVDTLIELADDPCEAIEWAETLVHLDPLREDVHRLLIRLYAAAGRRADALRQYDVCVRCLDEDLGVQPLIETTLVAAAVREGVPPLPSEIADPRRALRELRDALATCQAAVARIESALASMPLD